MKIKYLDVNMNRSSLAIVEAANQIIEDYSAQGFRLTLRQLYYQFVSRDLFANTVKNYKRLGNVIANARNAGLVDWDAIEDRTRNVISQAHWGSPAEIIEACADQFCFDLWENQPSRVEVWIEKDALVGVFEDVCNELDVPLFSCRGYTSQSEIWSAGVRMKRQARDGQTPVILHFGDHDPSGIDMTRDIVDRVSLYSGLGIDVDRLALNRNQVDEYEPPPNPAKTTDTRFTKYVEIHGDESWELDALEPSVLVELVRDSVAKYRDEQLWNETVQRQDEARERLLELSENWE